jgi:hypothetical protein
MTLDFIKNNTSKVLTSNINTSDGGQSNRVTNLNISNSVDTDSIVLAKSLYTLKNKIDLVNHSHLVNKFITNDSINNKPINSELSFNNQILVSVLSGVGDQKHSRFSNLITNNVSTNLNNQLKNLIGMDYNVVSNNMLLDSSFNLSGGVNNMIDTSTPLNMAKQERWVMKNSSVSRGLSNSNNIQVDAKKLIGNALENTSISDLNL